MGIPKSLSERRKIVQQVEALLREGVKTGTALKQAGVTSTTYRMWKEFPDRFQVADLMGKNSKGTEPISVRSESKPMPRRLTVTVPSLREGIEIDDDAPIAILVVRANQVNGVLANLIGGRS